MNSLIITLILSTTITLGATVEPRNLAASCSLIEASTSCPTGQESRADFTGDSLNLAAAQSVQGQPAPNAIDAPDVAPAPSSLRSTRDPTCVEEGLERCELIVNVPPEASEEPAPASGPITIADLASFTPAAGELVVQPDGWGALGVPTNFVATTTDHVQRGTLLGQPVEVRWRPTAFIFDYGDGTTARSTHGGTQWSSADDEWTTTETSHEYQALGSYVASVTVTFEADVATPGGWSPVPGSLDVVADSAPVRIFELRTVLARGDCVAFPTDPGCAP